MKLIKCDTQADATDLIIKARTLLKSRDHVSVADVKDLLGLSKMCNDSEYGWAVVDNVTYDATEGYLIFPDPERITCSIHINPEEFVKQAAEQLFINSIANIVNDEETSRIISDTLTIFSKNGVDTWTALSIMNDLGKMIKENGKDE